MFTVGAPPAQGWTDAMGGFHPYELRGLGRCVPCGDPPLTGLSTLEDDPVGANLPAYSPNFVRREQQKFGFGGLAIGLVIGLAIGAGAMHFRMR